MFSTCKMGESAPSLLQNLLYTWRTVGAQSCGILAPSPTSNSLGPLRGLSRVLVGCLFSSERPFGSLLTEGPRVASLKRDQPARHLPKSLGMPKHSSFFLGPFPSAECSADQLLEPPESL